MKKIRSEAEIAWRQERHDERWEIRAERQMRVFSRPTCLLPRQIGHLREQARQSQASGEARP